MKKLSLITLIVVIVLLPIILFFSMSNSETNPTPTPTTSSTDQVQATNTAVISTTLGDLTVELYGKEAPETVKNFITLAQEGKYNGTPFHRIIPEFMIQTGDFENQNGTGGHSYKGPGTIIPDEFAPNLLHLKGSLSMANRGPNTGGSQFFIVHAEATPWLDGMHSVFGRVTTGLDIVDKMATTETDAMDAPLKPILIESITVN